MPNNIIVSHGLVRGMATMKAAKDTVPAPVIPAFRIPPRTDSAFSGLFLGGGWQEAL